MVKLIVSPVVLQRIGGRRAKQRSSHAGVQMVLSDLAVATRANAGVDITVPVIGLRGQAQPNSDAYNSNQARSYVADGDGRHERSIARAGEVMNPPARSLEAIRT